MNNLLCARQEAPYTVPALRDHPTKLFVESTTRCNLSCVMCMKQSGDGIADGDLQPALFEALEPAFPQLDALVLNGIGEPLLNPRLESFICRAKKLMPAHGWIGFQTNGLLLTNLRAMTLVDAGVDRVCVSMDGVSPETFTAIRGAELTDLDWSLSALASAKVACVRPEVQVGVEFVIMRDNLRQLPAALKWATARGASFALVSHLLPYGEEHGEQCVYDSCSGEELALFQAWKVKAQVAGVDIGHYFKVLWKFLRTPEEQRVIDFVEAMKTDAQNRGITFDLKKLLQGQPARLDEVLEVFEEAQSVAKELGIDLRLPEAAPRQRRNCGFVEDGAAFVSCDGGVHPCYYLWHACRSFANGWVHPVRPKVFGTLQQSGILDIWNSAEFRAYRDNVLRHDYPYCPGCALAPCDFVQAEHFEQDCYVNNEPCGSCLWSAGMFQCLS